MAHACAVADRCQADDLKSQSQYNSISMQPWGLPGWLGWQPRTDTANLFDVSVGVAWPVSQA